MARQTAALYNIPEDLVLHVVRRESRFDPSARNGPYWGLMQIRYDTAQSMGYSGPPSGLLKAEVNLLYGTAYLANAYMVAGGNKAYADHLYRIGYYYEAKRKRVLAKLITAPAVAQPRVMLASVIPEPAAPMALVEEPVAAPSPTLKVFVPLPMPKPDIGPPLAHVYDITTSIAPIVTASLVPADLPDAPTIAVDPIPLPRARPAASPSAEAAPALRPALVASAAAPLPRLRPVTLRGAAIGD